MSYGNLFNEKPCRRCGSDKHAANGCGQVLALIVNPHNDPLIWPHALNIEQRLEYEVAWRKNRAVGIRYSGGLTLEELRKRVKDRASTSASSAISSTTPAKFAHGGNATSSTVTPSRTTSGPVAMPVRSKPDGTLIAGGNNPKGGTVYSTPVSTPSCPSKSQSGTGHRPLRRQSLCLRDSEPALKTDPSASSFSLVDKRSDFESLLAKQKSAKKADVFPLRPGFGLRDQNANIHTNHFRMTLPKALYRYTIGLTKVCSSWSQPARKRLIEAFFDHVNHFGQESDFATDYLLNIVSWKELKFPLVDQNLKKEAQVAFSCPSSMNDNLVFSSKVQFGRNQEHVAIYSHGQVDLNSFKNYVEGQPGCQEHDNSVACQSLNIIISKAARATQPDYQSFQLGSNRVFIKSRWDPLDITWAQLGRNPIETSRNLVVCHHGFSFTVKPAMGDVLLNVNNATSAFFHPRLVSDFIRHHNGMPGFQRLLRGVRVYVDYRGKQSHSNDDDPSNKIKTINGFGDRLGEQTFEKDGKIVSAYDHLANKYSHQRIDRASWSVNLGGKDKTKLWYAPEMLRILPYQPYRAKLSPEQTKNMINQACKTPPVKISEILGGGLRSINMEVSSTVIVPNAGLEIDPRMLTVPSRQAPEPLLYFRSVKVLPQVRQGRWSLPQGAQFLSNTTGFKGGFHYLFLTKVVDSLGRNDPRPEQIHNDFVGVLTSLGIRFRAPAGTYTGMSSYDVAEIRRGVSEAVAKSASLVVLLLMNPSTQAYSDFKIEADRRVGLQSICLSKYWKSKNKTGYLKNVGMKVNLKLGNINTTVNNGFGTAGGKPIDRNVMILGADVTHPSAMSSHGTPSIAAVVGSVDGTFGKFLGSMRWQQPDERSDGTLKQSKEIIEDMRSMARERLNAYYLVNNKLPDYIIYYRDGVSEAQRTEVKKREVTAIKAAYQDITATNRLRTEVPVTTIIVTKRHGTRFFPTDGSKKVNLNIAPGTVVDSCVTSPYYFDFFLSSHAGIQGTSKPAHYFVVENGLNFNATELQNFTQKICAIYVRAMMTVSYASPAYYADRLCERGRIYLRDFYDGSIPADLDQDQFRTRLNNTWNHNRNPWHDRLGGTMFWM